jgi:hypothetical protein
MNNIVLHRRLWKNKKIINEQRHRTHRFDGNSGKSFNYNFGWTEAGENSIGVFSGVQVIEASVSGSRTVHVWADYELQEQKS